MPVKDIHFFRPSHQKEGKQHQPPTINIPTPQLDKQRIYRELFDCSPDAVVFTVLPGFVVPKQPVNENTMEPNLPSSLSELFKSQYCSLSKADLAQLVSDTFDNIQQLRRKQTF